MPGWPMPTSVAARVTCRAFIERVERDQEIEVDAAEIHATCVCLMA